MRRRCWGCAHSIGTTSDLDRTGCGSRRSGRYHTASDSRGHALTESGDGLTDREANHDSTGVPVGVAVGVPVGVPVGVLDSVDSVAHADTDAGSRAGRHDHAAGLGGRASR
jgi:hypothetical protein